MKERKMNITELNHIYVVSSRHATVDVDKEIIRTAAPFDAYNVAFEIVQEYDDSTVFEPEDFEAIVQQIEGLIIARLTKEIEENIPHGKVPDSILEKDEMIVDNLQSTPGEGKDRQYLKIYSDGDGTNIYVSVDSADGIIIDGVYLVDSTADPFVFDDLFEAVASAVGGTFDDDIFPDIRENALYPEQVE